MTDKMPWEQIKALYDERINWPDRKLIAELTSLASLPDEDDPAWEQDETWQRAYLFVAHADLAAARRLIQAIPLLYERATYGDPGELMRGLRHNMEAIVKPMWSVLTRLSMQAAAYPQKGARMWAISQLGVLREAVSFDTIAKALTDEAELVRQEARLSLQMLCQTNPTCRTPAIRALEARAKKTRRKAELADLNAAIDAIKQLS